MCDPMPPALYIHDGLKKEKQYLGWKFHCEEFRLLNGVTAFNSIQGFSIWSYMHSIFDYLRTIKGGYWNSPNEL